MILNVDFHDNNKLFLFSFLNPSINRLLYTYLLIISFKLFIFDFF